MSLHKDCHHYLRQPIFSTELWKQIDKFKLLFLIPGHFRCDHIACPPETDRCVVIKESQPNDISDILRSNVCLSKTNKILKKSLTYQTGHSTTEVRELFEVYRNGRINLLSTNDYDDMKFRKKFSQFEKGLSQEMNKLNQDMEKMEHELEHMFV